MEPLDHSGQKKMFPIKKIGLASLNIIFRNSMSTVGNSILISFFCNSLNPIDIIMMPSKSNMQGNPLLCLIAVLYELINI